MSQERLLDFLASRTTTNLNSKWENVLPAALARDISVQKGTGDFDVTINAGYWLCDGVLVRETAALTDEVTLDSPSGSDRIDVIYGTFAYEADTEPTPASYGIKKGTPGDTPVEPSLGTNEVKIASIYVPSDASDLDDCYIRNAITIQAQLTELLGVQVQGNFWVAAAGDPFLTSGNPTVSLVYETGIADGDLWVDLTGLDLYIYNSDQNEWVTSDVSAHASTHYNEGSDEVDVRYLADSLGYLHLGTKAAHDALALSHTSLSSVGANDHHPKNHNTTHHLGGADPVDVKDLVDSEAYLHKTHPGLCPTPHDNAHHSEAYATDPHDHSQHSGTIAAGFISFLFSPSADCQTGEKIAISDVPDIAIDDTAVQATDLRADVDTAPSADIIYTFKRNAVSLGTVTILSGQKTGTATLDPVVALSAGDEIQLDAPADTKGAKGLRAYVSIERVAA